MLHQTLLYVCLQVFAKMQILKHKENNWHLNYLITSILYLSCPLIEKNTVCVITKIKMLTLIQINRGLSVHVYKTMTL